MAAANRSPPLYSLPFRNPGLGQTLVSKMHRQRLAQA